MEEAKKALKAIIDKFNVEVISIGNGTASRESEQFIAALLPEAPGVAYVIVSEAGASVYSASKLAAKEFPNTTSRSEARFPSRGACRTRWPNW